MFSPHLPLFLRHDFPAREEEKKIWSVFILWKIVGSFKQNNMCNFPLLHPKQSCCHQEEKQFSALPIFRITVFALLSRLSLSFSMITVLFLRSLSKKSGV
jgi:hypothetical protein